ncbi:MAG: cytochrome c3 family protein, partial [Planctomycetota bacterium]
MEENTPMSLMGWLRRVYVLSFFLFAVALFTDCFDNLGAFSFSASTLYAGYSEHEGNIDLDLVADFSDLALLAQHWLDTYCDDQESCRRADLNGDGTVDMVDFAILARNWDSVTAEALSLDPLRQAYAIHHGHEGNDLVDDDSCIDCHSQPQGLRRQVVGVGGDFEQTSSHVVGDGNNEHCTLCHEMSEHQLGAVLLRNPDNGGVWTGSRTEWCLTCHDGDPPVGVTFPPENGSGYDKSSFINSTHHRRMGSSSCSHCHNAHGSPNNSLLKESYVTTDYNGWSKRNGDYAQCWICHYESDIVTGDNAFGRQHDRHVRQEYAPCIICHDV